MHMEEVLRFAGEDIEKLVKECEVGENLIKDVATELFADKINVTRIAFLIAFTEKLIQHYSHAKETILTDLFSNIYKNIKFHEA